MATYSWFKSEKDIAMRDRELYRYLAPLRKKNDWAALVCDYYDDPRPKPHNRKGLKLPKPEKGKLPPFTFAVFDGCRIHGYWDTREVGQLKSILRALGAFARAPRRSVRVGYAFFDAEGMRPFGFMVNYWDGGRIIAYYDQPVQIAFDDADLPAPLPRPK